MEKTMTAKDCMNRMVNVVQERVATEYAFAKEAISEDGRCRREYAALEIESLLLHLQNLVLCYDLGIVLLNDDPIET